MFLGENLSLTQGEAHERRSGTQHLWHLGGIPKTPRFGARFGGEGNLSKNQKGGVYYRLIVGEVRFPGEVRFGEKLKMIAIFRCFFEVSINIEVKHFEISHLKWRNLCPVPVITIFFVPPPTTQHGKTNDICDSGTRKR